MSESVQHETEPETRRKYSFGIPCTRCGKSVQLGQIHLKNDATLDDLRNADAQDLGQLRGGICENLDANNQRCNEENLPERADLVFVDDSMQLPHMQANDPWRE
jgi:hypothetical protein